MEALAIIFPDDSSACERNKDLRAIGLELQQEVADLAGKNIRSWGLEERATIEHCDIRKFESDQKFDLITLHQNIYYFAVEERVSLARQLSNRLKPSGKLVITSAGPGVPSLRMLNLLVSNTEGCDSLPNPDQLRDQLKEAGFEEVRIKRLIPFDILWAFIAARTRVDLNNRTIDNRGSQNNGKGHDGKRAKIL